MPGRHRPLPVALRADLFAHLAAMEQAGLPPDQAFALLRLTGAANARLNAARRLLARGNDPARAGRHSGLFDELEASCVHAALQAGSPAGTYRRLAGLYAEKCRLAAAMRSGMLVPLATFVIALLVRPLPALVAGSLTPGGYLLQVLLPLLVAAGLFQLSRRLPRWLASEAPAAIRSPVERSLLRLPLFGPLAVRGGVRDFLVHLAIMLEAGLPMFDALPIATATVGNRTLRAELARIEPAMIRGATLTQALSALHLEGSERLVGQVLTGEQAGRLPEMLFRHVEAETAALALAWQQIVAWLPRLFYVLLLVWIGYGMISGGAFMPSSGEAR